MVEREDLERDKFVDRYQGSTAVRTFPGSDFFVNVALGLIEGASTQGVSASSTVGEGAANEQVIGDGMTGRYPFPSSPAQMDIVSTSANDTLTGTGARVILVRGNITGNVELFEAVLLDGTNTVQTTNEYLRVNTIGVVSTGSGGKNEGIITLKNGSDLLAQANAGKNISRTGVFSIAADTTGLLKKTSIFTGYNDNATITIHVFEPELNLIDFAAFEQQTYVNQIDLDFREVALVAGSDFEVTAYSEATTGDSQVGVLFDFLIIDD